MVLWFDTLMCEMKLLHVHVYRSLKSTSRCILAPCSQRHSSMYPCPYTHPTSHHLIMSHNLPPLPLLSLSTIPQTSTNLPFPASTYSPTDPQTLLPPSTSSGPTTNVSRYLLPNSLLSITPNPLSNAGNSSPLSLLICSANSLINPTTLPVKSLNLSSSPSPSPNTSNSRYSSNNVTLAFS